jgi:tetratricopeptide (TPR) repeat protein
MMNRFAINTKLPLILLIAVMAVPVAGQVSFTASADRAVIASGEKAVIVATLVTTKAVSGVPSAGSSDAFDVLNVNTGSSQSHSIQMINGRIEQKSETTYRYIYTIVSKTDGAFAFPALTVSVDGTNYSTRPLQFNAGGGGGGGISGGGTGGGSVGGAGGEPAQAQRGPDIRVTLDLSKKVLYVGEQAVLTLKVAQKAGTPIQTQRGYSGAVDQIEKAFASGFSLNRLFTTQVTQAQERIGADLYNTFILKFAVFGLTAGEYQIGAVNFDYDEIVQSRSRQINPFFQDFFEMDFFGGGRQAVPQRLRTAPFTVTVKPRPSGAPAGYGGSVGKFSVSASVEPQTVTAGEALTLRVMLKGDTRASNVGDPVLPELKNCDIFTPERQTTVDTVALGLSTRKTYRYLIIPQRDGALTIEPVTYTYLDPESGTYKTARSDTLRVSVAPGKTAAREQTRYLTQEEIRQVGSDIRYIKTPARLANMDERPYRAPHWYLLFPMPFLIFISTLIYKEQSKRSGENRFKAMRQKALGNAVKELNRAGKGGTDNEFLGKASNVIEKYISRKFAFPATGRTLDELKEELLLRKIDEQTVAGLTALIEGINEYRFGGKAFDSRSRGEIIKQTASFLSTLEKSAQKAKGAAQALAVLAVLAVPLAVSPAAASPTSNVASREAWFQKANEFYAANSYDSALACYSKILDAGVKNDAVYYNMGNCYYRLMKPGLARLYYEKAAALSPRDPDIEANIKIVTSVIVDRPTADDRTESDFLTSVLYGIHTLLPLNVQLIALCGLLFILSLLASAMLMKRGLARLWLAYGAVLCALLIIVAGASAGYKIYAMESRQYAVILAPSADAKNQPSGNQTLFTAHEGTKLRIIKTVGEWSLVSLPNGASGWVPAEALGKI